MVIYRSKDKSKTQGNLAELAGNPAAPLWCRQPSLLKVVRSLVITMILRRDCHGQSFGKAERNKRLLSGNGSTRFDGRRRMCFML